MPRESALAWGALPLGHVDLQVIHNATGAFSSPFLCPLNAKAGRTDDMSLIVISLWWGQCQARVQDRASATD